MAEFSEYDAHYAQYIVEQLMSAGEKNLEIENDIVIDDLELDISQFYAELQILAEFNKNVPVIRVDGYLPGYVPVSFHALFSNTTFPWDPFANFGSREKWWSNIFFSVN
jgi:hypothetical protein